MGGRHVDVVVADGGVRHDAQTDLVAGPEHVGIDAVSEQADDAVAPSCLSRQFLGGERDVVIVGVTIS